MRKLIRGIVDFRERLRAQYAERFQALAQGQAPDSLFVTCSDSRVVPDLLASTDPGDLFIMRNVGNLVPPATAEGASTGDLSEASAIEYAILVLKVRNMVVCGHSECGAMKAALARKPMPDMPNLAKWLHHSAAALFRLDQEGPLDPRLNPHDQLSQLNVLVQLEHLATYPIVRELHRRRDAPAERLVVRHRQGGNVRLSARVGSLKSLIAPRRSGSWIVSTRRGELRKRGDPPSSTWSRAPPGEELP